jgi:hypothetical protein
MPDRATRIERFTLPASITDGPAPEQEAEFHTAEQARRLQSGLERAEGVHVIAR